MGKTNVMLDLETLGTSQNALIVSIGAVEFSKEGISAQFYRRIDIESSIRHGFKIDGETLSWWALQSDTAKKEAFALRNPPLSSVLDDFKEWIFDFSTEGKMINVWGNGSDFDNAILKNAYERLAFCSVPWHYANNRCFRTLRSLFPNVEKPEDEDSHTAIGDARWQGLYAINIWKEIEDRAFSGDFTSFFR